MKRFCADWPECSLLDSAISTKIVCVGSWYAMIHNLCVFEIRTSDPKYRVYLFDSYLILRFKRACVSDKHAGVDPIFAGNPKTVFLVVSLASLRAQINFNHGQILSLFKGLKKINLGYFIFIIQNKAREANLQMMTCSESAFSI